MTFRDDIAKWQFKKLKQPYDVVAKRAGLSSSTVWAICADKGTPGDPSVSTVLALFKGLSLKPEYALNFQIKKSRFHLAVSGGANGR